MSQNPLVYLDFSIDDGPIHRLKIELFDDVVPKTAENFLQLCLNQEHQKGFKGVPFHRILKNLLAQGGDITNHNGTGGRSHYGPTFYDENFVLKHDSRGIVSMSNSGRNSNSSQFFIAFRPLPFLDGAHVVFGKVTPDTLGVLDVIEEVGTPSDYYRLNNKVVIVGCGEIKQ